MLIVRITNYVVLMDVLMLVTWQVEVMKKIEICFSFIAFIALLHLLLLLLVSISYKLITRYD